MSGATVFMMSGYMFMALTDTTQVSLQKKAALLQSVTCLFHRRHFDMCEEKPGCK